MQMNICQVGPKTGVSPKLKPNLIGKILVNHLMLRLLGVFKFQSNQFAGLICNHLSYEMLDKDLVNLMLSYIAAYIIVHLFKVLCIIPLHDDT